MFVKIRYLKVEKDEKKVIIKSNLAAEHLYDCNHFTLYPTMPVPPEVDETEMNVSLEFNKSGPCGWDKTISFPCESKTTVVEIFIMNEHGRTVDRYVY